MIRRAAPLLVAVLAAVVAAGVLALVLRTDEPRAVRALAARATVSPLAGMFGDAFLAEVDVALDSRAVDPDSVRVSIDFGALQARSRAAPARERAGETVRLRYRYSLACVRDPCRPRARERRIAFPPVILRYRLVAGGERRLRLRWPAPIVLGSRITPADVAQPVWRVREHPLPAVSYRVPPAAVAAVAYALAALLALAGFAVLAAEALALSRRGVRDPLAGLTPLERALALLARAVSEGGPTQQRRALDRLARELRRTGEDELAADARRLAWSRRRPERAQVAALAASAAAARSAW